MRSSPPSPIRHRPPLAGLFVAVLWICYGAEADADDLLPMAEQAMPPPPMYVA